MKKKKPFFLRWWFILLVIIVVVASNAGSKKKINWDEMELGNMIPEPPSMKGVVYDNSDEELWVSLEDVTDAQYNDYVDGIIEMGFVVDADKDSNSYKAFNAAGYCVDITHFGDRLKIELEEPMELGAITWPNSTAGKKLPIPKSAIGKFSYEYEDSFFVYIGNTTKTDFAEYVTACSNAGFKVDYDKGETYYYADNAEGWHVSLNYKGYSIMSIGIDPPEEEETEEPENTSKPTATSKTTETAKTKETAAPKKTSNATGLDPDFKAAMDSYEEFMDQYVTFMKKYNANPSDLSLLTDFAKYMGEYATVVRNFEKWEDEDLNAEETQYYITVQSRVSQKLLEVAQ